MFKARYFAAILAASLGLGLGGLATSAHASTGQPAVVSWVDTSLQASGFSGFFQTSSSLGPVSFSSTNQLSATSSNPAECNPVMFSGGFTTISGETVTVSSSGLISASGGHAVPATSMVVTAKDSCQNISVATVSVTVTPGSLPFPDHVTSSIISTDTVAFTPPLHGFATDDNSSGGIQFHSASTSNPVPASALTENYTVMNLPAGIGTGGTDVIGTGELGLPATAIPGMYNGVQVSVRDSDGAVANGTFHLKVNGHKVNSFSLTGTIVDFSGMCLDVRNAFGTAAPGQLLQIWHCGAAGGEDQVFTYSTSDHTLKYQGLCVAETAFDGQASLQACGSPDTTVTRSGMLYRFGSSGTVLDVAGFGKTNGTRVLSWVFNGGANQDWSLPQ